MGLFVLCYAVNPGLFRQDCSFLDIDRTLPIPIGGNHCVCWPDFNNRAYGFTVMSRTALNRI